MARHQFPPAPKKQIAVQTVYLILMLSKLIFHRRLHSDVRGVDL